MRPEMKSTQNELLSHHKRNYVYITFHWGRNEMKFYFGVGLGKTVHSVKANHFCFDEINAYANVSFHMISFWVVFTWHFVTRNEISFLSKWPQLNDTRNEFHFGLYHVNCYKKLTRHQNENISFSCKHPLIKLF